ncbi:LysR family transcriptional regulator substrate-binding protein [Paenibacillus ginsengarvi]|uniref:LysR family transcriptional regulator substrate-binding protein n=1 Tax=Paenibacillus ginsengarvi TaxID=400777 RepID=UPI0023D94FF6|nr:LysR family transcriptional regulator substrate-binding protein [Paenibacillus ginsengarvi]
MQKADAALELLEEAARTIEELTGEEKGSIVVAESGPSPIAALSDSFRLRYPVVQLNVVRMPEEELRTRIRNSDIDFAISAMPPEGPGIEAATVFREEISIAVSQGHRFAGRETIALEELAEEPFVGYGYGHPFHEWLESFCARAGFSMNIVCGLDNPAAICRTVAAGLGVAFVGECDADATGSLIRLRIEDQACSRTFRLVWHEGRYLSAAARLFRDELAAGFAAAVRCGDAAAW